MWQSYANECNANVKVNKVLKDMNYKLCVETFRGTIMVFNRCNVSIIAAPCHVCPLTRVTLHKNPELRKN